MILPLSYHSYVGVAAFEVAVNVTAVPAHTAALLLEVIVAVGNGLTVTEVATVVLVPAIGTLLFKNCAAYKPVVVAV